MRPSFSRIFNCDAISSSAAFTWFWAISYNFTLKPADAKIIAYDRPIRPEFRLFTSGLHGKVLIKGLQWPYHRHEQLKLFSSLSILLPEPTTATDSIFSIFEKNKVWQYWTAYHVTCSHCFISNDSKNWANFIISINQYLWFFISKLFVSQILLILKCWVLFMRT